MDPGSLDGTEMKQMRARHILLLAAGVGWLLREAYGRRGYHFGGKVVLITGGSRGLGLILARELVRRGALVAICARDSQALERARRELIAMGGRALAVPCDITDRVQVEELARRVHSHFGRIDVVINNAGTISVGPIDVMTPEDFDEAMQTHFWGPVYLTLAVLPEMRGRREGRIINIASIGGKVSVPHLLPYCASKFALVGFSQGLRAELAKEGIVVTTVNPGLMRTGSPRNAIFKGRHRAEYAWFALSDALPLTSMDAERAARQILAASARGDAEVILSAQAKLAARAAGVAPGLTANVLSLFARVLPRPGGIGTGWAKGSESRSALVPSVLTALDERAAQRHNQLSDEAE